MQFFKTILHIAGIVYAVLAALLCGIVLVGSNAQQAEMQTLALAATSLACLQASQALRDKS